MWLTPRKLGVGRRVCNTYSNPTDHASFGSNHIWQKGRYFGQASVLMQNCISTSHVHRFVAIVYYYQLKFTLDISYNDSVADLGRGRTDARCPVWSCSAVRWNPRLPSFAHARTWLQHRLKGVIRLRKIDSWLCDVTLPKPGVRPSV